MKYSILLSTLLLSLLCTAYAADPPCGSGHGLSSGTDCLCESGYTFDNSDCTQEALTTCNPIAAPDDLSSPSPVTLGAGVNEGAFTLYINVPMEQTRVFFSATFDVDTAGVTTNFDYPAAFADYDRTFTEASTCADIFSISISNDDIDTAHTAGASIQRIVAGDGSSVEYTGTVKVVTKEKLSDNSTREITQLIPFDYTFPVVTASISNIDVVSTIGTILKSNVLQQQNADNTITMVVQLSTPFPYQLDWVDNAPITGTKFAGTKVTFPVMSPTALVVSTQPITACDSTVQGALCVQTAEVDIDYSSGCSVDGSYTLEFAVTGCNSAGGSTPGIDCLVTNDNTIENITVSVTISSLQMGNLCAQKKIYNADTSSLLIYADSGLTTQKSKFIAGDTAQKDMFFGTTLAIGPDQPSIDAYQGFSIISVSRMCAGVSSCTGLYVDFDIADVDDLSGAPGPAVTAVKFSVPVAKFTELTPSFSDIPYSVRVTLSLSFTDNSKRSVVLERNAPQSLPKQAIGTVQFVSESNAQPNNNNDNNNDAQASSASKTSFSAVSIAALCVGAVALVASI